MLMTMAMMWMGYLYLRRFNPPGVAALFSASFSIYRGFMMLVALLMLLAIYLVLTRTRIGLVIQAALTFTQEGQWRNLRENPELFTALLPKDVRPAGTCDIQPAADLNSISYSCSGSKPEIFIRR